tara:strand:- start:194 stop:1816 length:1623 start_codon:yes stop_codon:yes gene_type:complete
MTEKRYPAQLVEGLVNCRNLFAEINQKYWSKFEDNIPSGRDEYVLVDFLVGHPGYMIGNAITAKYLQYLEGFKAVVLAPSRKHDWMINIAKSFGFDEFVFEDESDRVPPAIFNTLPFNQAKSPEELREFVLATELNGLAIGDLIYDSFISGESPGTITEVTPKLIEAVLSSIYYYNLSNNLFKNYKIGALTVGHRVYNRFGIMSRMAITKGIPVYGKKQRSYPAFTVRRDDTIKGCSNFEYEFSCEEFEESLRHITPEILEDAKQKVRLGYNGALNHKAHDDSRRVLNREELCQELNLDPNKPIVPIFSHCFTDSPHFCTENIFDDYVQWLLGTLEAATKNPNVNWLLKAHPNQPSYQCTQSAQSIFHEYAKNAPNLALAPDDYHIHTFYDIASAAVTCSGSAGLEFPCLGIPTVTAANGFYGGKGFTMQAKSQKEYSEILENIENHFEFSSEQQERALAYWHLIYMSSRIESQFMPTFVCRSLEPHEEIPVWFDAAHLLNDKSPFEDPFFQAFKFQVENKKTHPFPRGFWKEEKKDEAA